MIALGRSLVLFAVAAAIALAVGGRARSSQIVLRLGSHDFGRIPAGGRAPVASIGGETREVLAMPASEPIADFENVRGSADGAVRLDVRLPERLASDARPPAIRVTAIGPPADFDIPTEKRGDLTVSTWWKELDHGWSLRRSDSDRSAATLDLAIPATIRSNLLWLLRLSALVDPPSTLESRDFALPEDAVIDLGYGLVRSPAFAGTAIDFRAVLACDGRDTLLLADRLVPGTSHAERWRDVAIPLEIRRSESCRLRLTAATDDGSSTPFALWTPARFRTASPSPGADAPNFVLISLDTLRADHLSGYGYARPTSPSIDARLIGRGTTFADATTTFPMTDVAHLSLFTALFPSALPNPARVAPEAPIRMLAEQLRDAGFETAAFTEDALLAGSSGFWFGFDRFVERNVAREARGRPTFADGVRHLRARGDRRFFLFLHTYRVHAPYGASASYDRSLDGAPGWESGLLDDAVPTSNRGDVDRYDRAIREADDLVAAVLDEIDRQGLAERTLVVLLSDHGEAFREHGSVGHGYAFHQEQMHIPIVLRGPGVPVGRRIEGAVSIVDVAPTVLQLLGVAPLDDVDGVDLTDSLSGRIAPDRPLFFSWLPGDERVGGVRRGALKLVERAGRARVFDLAKDPGERRPLPASDPRVDALREDLVAYRARASQRARVESKAVPHGNTTGAAVTGPTPEVADALRALGYVAESEPSERKTAGDDLDLAGSPDDPAETR